MTQFSRPLGAGFNAREADPTPTPASTSPSSAPPSEVAPTGYRGHARTVDELPGLDRGRLAPAFRQFSKALGAELARDERERERTVAQALGTTEIEEARLRRGSLAEAVRAGIMSEAEACAEWDRHHSDIDPATLRPRTS